MQVIGIALLAIGVWVAYCGAKGINAGEMALVVIRDPGNARAIIADASAKATEPYQELIGVANTVSIATAPNGVKGLNPFAAFPISDDWAKHVKRGSAGGTDYVMPVGTPLVTPLAGTVQNFPNAGAAGNMTKVKLDDGYTVVMMHLSAFAKANGDRVTPWSIVGRSGGAKGSAGAGSSTGAHLHIHVVTPTGGMMEWQKYLAGKGGSSGV